MGLPYKTYSKKISARLKVLKRISPFIPFIHSFDTRMNTYNALVMPYFNYCSTVWGNIGIGLADIKSKNYKTWLPETSPFLITRYAQMCYWMSLTGKDLKFLCRNNLLCVCTTCIIIFPYHTSPPPPPPPDT